MSSDAGASWTPLPLVVIPKSADQPTKQMRGAWTAIAFSPGYANDRTLWVGTDVTDNDQRFAVFRSADNGQTWRPMEASAIDRALVYSLFTIQVDPSERNRVFAGTSRGIAESFDDGETWRSGGRTSRPAPDIAGRIVRAPSLMGIIVAATEDGAVWSVNRGIDWVREPESPRDVRAVTVTTDAKAFVIGNPQGISRYQTGVGSD